MSWVGSEVNVKDGVPFPADTSRIQEDDDGDDDEVMEYGCGGDRRAMCTSFDSHRPVTPQGAAEQLFLGFDLATNRISAVALAEEIHKTVSSSAVATTLSNATADDFATARDSDDADADDFSKHSPSSYYFDDDDEPPRLCSEDTTATTDTQRPRARKEPSPFGNDALVFGRESIGAETETSTTSSTATTIPARTPRQVSPSPSKNSLPPESEFHDPAMPEVTPPTTTTTATPTLASPPASTSTAAGGDLEHVDVAEKVYESAKGIWNWGKGIIVFSPFMGLAEGVAGKVVGIATRGNSDLSDVDGCVTGAIHTVDDNILNPAIFKVVSIVLGAVGQTESAVKPLLLAMLKPLGLIKDEPENSTADPEVTGTTTTGTNTVVVGGKKNFPTATTTTNTVVAAK